MPVVRSLHQCAQLHGAPFIRTRFNDRLNLEERNGLLASERNQTAQGPCYRFSLVRAPFVVLTFQFASNPGYCSFVNSDHARKLTTGINPEMSLPRRGKDKDVAQDQINAFSVTDYVLRKFRVTVMCRNGKYNDLSWTLKLEQSTGKRARMTRFEPN